MHHQLIQLQPPGIPSVERAVPCPFPPTAWPMSSASADPAPWRTRGIPWDSNRFHHSKWGKQGFTTTVFFSPHPLFHCDVELPPKISNILEKISEVGASTLHGTLFRWVIWSVASCHPWTQGVTSDTACSSSLVALDTAAANIGRNRCSASVSAGVNMNLLPGPFVACCQVSRWHEAWGGLWWIMDGEWWLWNVMDHEIGWNFRFSMVFWAAFCWTSGNLWWVPLKNHPLQGWPWTGTGQDAFGGRKM